MVKERQKTTTMLNLDRYAYSNALKNVHPIEKFFFAMATMIICLVANSLLVSLVVIILMTGVSVLMGKIPLRFYVRLMLIPASFLVVATTTIAINIVDNSSHVLWGWQFFNVTIGVTIQSMHTALKLLLRSLAALCCLYFLTLTTPSVEIISILRKLKFPELFIDLMSLIYRFLFVLLETANQIHTAQTVRLGYTSIRQSYRSMGQLVVNLFLNSYQRAMHLYTALEARGYTGSLRVLERQYQLSKTNILIILLTDILLIIIGRGSY